MVVNGDVRFHRFFETTDALADFILAKDALGLTVYHACATFKTPANRKGDNAQGASSLWSDVDAGDGKPYQTLADVIQAAAEFCRRAGFPAPLVVSSGFGGHLYWPGDLLMDVAAWRARARALQQLFAQFGFHVDAVRTCDVASVLRTPGTYNRKGGAARLVECGPLVGPYDLKKFCPEVSQPLRIRHDPKDHITSAAFALYEDVPADPDLVAIGCAQIRAVRARPAQFQEPVIYAAIGVLRHCGHAWRDWFDPAWHDQVDKKVAQHEAADVGPTTCAHFQTIDPKGCQGCPHVGHITSPVQLGRGAVARTSINTDARLPAEPGRAGALYEGSESTTGMFKKANGYTHAFTTEAGQALVGLEVPGFDVKPDGLFTYKEGVKGERIPIKILSQPFRLRSVQRHEADDAKHSLVFDHDLPLEQREIVLPSGVAFSNRSIPEFADRGVVVHEPDQLRRYIKVAIDEWYRTKPMETRYDQFGWKEDDTAFLCGNRLYRKDSIQRVTGSSELIHRSKYLRPVPGGSVRGWAAAASKLFAVGLEPQSFGLLCSFGAPLMRFHTHKEGGAIASFVNDVTGGGKTTTLEGGATVWGLEDGIKLGDQDTQVAKGLKLGIMGNLPMAYDELATKDPELIRQFVLVFTDGKDKDRGTPDGNLIHNRAQWQTILLLASNKPVFELLHSLPGATAHAFRVLEFVTEIPKHIDRTKGDELRRQLEANAGWAGDAYLRHLVQPEIISYVKNSIVPVTDDIWRRGKGVLNGDHRFWVRMIASALIGGNIAQQLGLIEFSIERITNWVIEYAMDQAKAVHIDPQRRDLDLLNSFILRNPGATLQVQHAWRPRALTPPVNMPTREILIRHEIDDQRLWIEEMALREWLLKNNAHRTLFERRMLQLEVLKSVGRFVTLTAGTTKPSGQVRAYEVDLGHPMMSGILRALSQEPAAESVPRAAGPAPTASA